MKISFHEFVQPFKYITLYNTTFIQRFKLYSPLGMRVKGLKDLKDKWFIIVINVLTVYYYT